MTKLMKIVRNTRPRPKNKIQILNRSEAIVDGKPRKIRWMPVRSHKRAMEVAYVYHNYRKILLPIWNPID